MHSLATLESGNRMHSHEEDTQKAGMYLSRLDGWMIETDRLVALANNVLIGL